MKIVKTLASMLVLIFLISIVSDTAIAGAPPAVPTKPTPQPSGGGGGSSPSYSAPAAFQTYTNDLRASDGTVVGSLTGVDYFTVRLNAAGTGTVNGKNHSVTVTADLNSMPASPVMDITMGPSGNLPGGTGSLTVISAVDVAAQSATGWSLKAGTAKVTFSVPSALVTADTDAKCYVVYYDGTNYHFIAANVADSDGVATIEAPVPGISGTFTAVISGAAKPAPSPTAAPAPTPEPTPVPTPAPEPSGFMGFWSSLWISTFGTFAIGEAAGAVILVLMGRFWK